MGCVKVGISENVSVGSSADVDSVVEEMTCELDVVLDFLRLEVMIADGEV